MESLLNMTNTDPNTIGLESFNHSVAIMCPKWQNTASTQYSMRIYATYINYLETEPLSYQVSKAPTEARMFKAYIFMPSACINFYNNSRKIVSLDGAHMLVRFDGACCINSYK